ncbi:MAG: hypothetical protein ACYDHZ_02540 [Dehalococcoidia bacterium]
MDNLFRFWRHYRWAVGITLSLAVLSIAWFALFPYRTFTGDDLWLIVQNHTGGYASSLVNAFTQHLPNAYTPVFAAFFYLESLAFGTDFRSYIYCNIFIEFLNSCLVSLICYRLSRKQPFVALVAGVMFIVSRFAYFHVLQVFAPLEGLALFSVLLMIFMVLRAYDVRKPIFLIWSSLFYLLAIFTHVRFIAVGGFLVVAILLAPVNFKLRWQRFVIATIPIIILLFNYLLKTLIFKMIFFVGAGGTPIIFDYYQFLKFMFAGSVNMLGFNLGPSYLSGLDVFSAGITGFALGGFLTASMAALILAYIYYQFYPAKKINKYEIRNILLFLALFVPLLASASVTFRLEFRWLYAPYVAIIFFVAYLSGRISPAKWVRFLLIICVFISAISVDIYYRRYLDNVYFFDSLRVADSARDTIIDKYGSSLSQKQIFLIGAGGDVRKWYFQDDKFFKFYTGDPDIKIQYVDSVAEIKNYRIDSDNILVFSLDPIKREFADITETSRTALVNRPTSLIEPSFDFLAKYTDGKINNTQKVSTPNGSGVFTTDWPGDLVPEKTITIVSGFSYTYDKILIKEGDSLSFTAGMPLGNSYGVLAYIDVTTANGEQKRLFKADLWPATKSGVRWQSFLIPCTDYAGQEVSITFGVESPLGYSGGDWIAFGSPLLGSYK